MAWDYHGWACFLGLPHAKTNVDQAVAERFEKIRPKLTMRDGRNHLYDGPRCQAWNLGWRMLQDCRIWGVRQHGLGSLRRHYKWLKPFFWVSERFLSLRIRLGLCDKHIESAWHGAANCEYWYANDKEW